MVVQQVVVSDQGIALVEWTSSMRPFLEKRRECPQGVSSTRPLSDDDDPLAWYVA
jgi:hypothetical protein